MNRLSIRCIKAAFVCLALGIGLGAAFAFDRALGARLRPLHMELNVWGWVTLLIYGMGYHMLPRFSGKPLRAVRVAHAQSWLAIIGIGLVSGGWLLTLYEPLIARFFLISGGLMQLVAAGLFAALIGDLLLRQRSNTAC